MTVSVTEAPLASKAQRVMHMRFDGIRRVTVALAMTTLVACAQGAHAQRASVPSAAEAIVPFTIRIPDDVVTDLKQRLSRARFADEFADAGWNYGTNLAYLKSLVEYWRDTYDWRVHETRLNTLDQFKTNIDGIDIHFIHQRSSNPNARPLLLLNGWPSSIVEYTKVIGPLTDPARNGGRMEDSFHVVVPSMPGFGFSDKPRNKGYDTERIARMWVTLMARLGYDRYGVHGSDWGSNIATRVALNDPAHVAALHLAGCGGAPAGPAANTAGQANPPDRRRRRPTAPSMPLTISGIRRFNRPSLKRWDRD